MQQRRALLGYDFALSVFWEQVNAVQEGLIRVLSLVHGAREGCLCLIGMNDHVQALR